ncbi:hypothetical protein HOD05_03605 [Candidatus Woesearchaeota archaeon]|jgi:hypothetical protein|nr:hypothetical protein [Candidatus Woesearchaeota archaeon]MBT4150638.1 hypothetical protein [Candidatus Woesearchaeota archaeon]MBT4247856.1 hypothetical protein [Candidatus Woesearchaeota archaeon]MBT4434280.1 hypothetical protein [Candidatus Woesearchaeota archaeon]MBT7331891.1 hypothetical protein [Candidatus Woesearchaeota archaeon]
MAETITIRKELVERLITDFDELVHELEDEQLSEEALRRIKEVEEGKAKMLTEEEFLNKLRQDGIDISF